MNTVTNFNNLKKNSSKLFEKLTKEVEKLNPSSQQQYDSEDTRFWYPSTDKAGNGHALIRFLPAPQGEDFPFVRIFEHSFKNPLNNKWYIEKSLTTLGLPDPLSEYNSKLWDTGLEENQNTVRKQKRKLTFISNIYVIKDPAKPENEGKVFLFKYGKKIFEKLNAAMNPTITFEDEVPMNPFDFWTGATFKLKIRHVDGYRNYDASEFSSSAPLFNDDKKLEEVWNSQHSIQQFVDPKTFKTYDQLKSRLNLVLGLENAVTSSQFEQSNSYETVNDESMNNRFDIDNELPVNVDDDMDTEELLKKLAAEVAED